MNGPDFIAGAPVPSPCVNVCRIDADSGLCLGCLRTIDEIAAWSQMADPDKRAVWLALDERRAAGAGGDAPWPDAGGGAGCAGPSAGAGAGCAGLATGDGAGCAGLAAGAVGAAAGCAGCPARADCIGRAGCAPDGRA
jgi:predicted Fe-S protein YdhL (DUF1289 family)